MGIHVSGCDGNRERYHTDKHCRALKRANSVRYDEPKSRYPDLQKCQICDNGGKTGGKGSYEEETCGLCGGSYKLLSNHLVNCPERSQSPITSDD